MQKVIFFIPIFGRDGAGVAVRVLPDDVQQPLHQLLAVPTELGLLSWLTRQQYESQ